jgi:hypothetical protein
MIAQPITGFNAERFMLFPVLEVPLCVIDKPDGYRSLKRARKYARMLKEGSVAPPVELCVNYLRKEIEDEEEEEEEWLRRCGIGRLRPYRILNGEHRYGAAMLAGCKTIRAVISGVETETALVWFVEMPDRRMTTIAVRRWRLRGWSV